MESFAIFIYLNIVNILSQIHTFAHGKIYANVKVKFIHSYLLVAYASESEYTFLFISSLCG